MAKKFTRRCDVSTVGGVHTPHPLRFGAWWRILFLDDNGDMFIVEVHLPNTSCPRKWLEERKMVLGVDALAELIR